jgi:fluoroacetyl-CoA thioesterase
MSGTTVAAPEHFASRFTASAPDVFSTMALGALVETTAADWLAGYLDSGQMSVGAQLVINHTAPTPEGLTVTVTVRLVEAAPPRYDFEWTASDGVDEIGHGTHQRFAVDRARFESRVERKRQPGQ